MTRIRPGEPWGTPAQGPPDVVVRGDDGDLARVVAAHPGALVRYEPDRASDVARAVGLTAGAPVEGVELPLDALRLDDGRLALNMVIAGVPPDRLAPWAH